MGSLEVINMRASLEGTTNGLGCVAIAGTVEGVVITSYAGYVVVDG